jgi:class 3 adenylate cyclase
VPNPFDDPGRAIRCAGAIRDDVYTRRLEIWAGLHSGEIELHADDVSGIVVHVGQRVAAQARPTRCLSHEL